MGGCRALDGCIFHTGPLLGVFCASANVRTAGEDQGILAHVTMREGERSVVAVVAGEDQPLGMAAAHDIDGSIDPGDAAWRGWNRGLRHDGPHRAAVRRSALALNLLPFPPSVAIAVAVTTPLLDGKRPMAAMVVAVGDVCFQCGKAMLRSDLWNPDRRVPHGGFPSLGRILADQIKGGDAEACERGIEKRCWTALHQRRKSGQLPAGGAAPTLSSFGRGLG